LLIFVDNVLVYHKNQSTHWKIGSIVHKKDNYHDVGKSDQECGSIIE
jgi:hypothetical protein